MITATKFFITAATVLAISGLVVEHRLIARQEILLQSLRRQDAQLARRSAELLADTDRDRKIAEEALAMQTTQPATVFPAPDRASDSDPAVNAWLERVRLVKALLEATPSQYIPELQLLTAANWIDFTRRSEIDRAPKPERIENLFSQLRNAAKGVFAERATAALEGFVRSHHGRLPNQPGELAPYFEPAMDPAILDRYEMIRTGPRADLARNTPIMAEKSVINELYDRSLKITAGGGSTWGPSITELNRRIKSATEKFAAANGGRVPTGPEQLMPHLGEMGVDLPTLQKFWSSPLRGNGADQTSGAR